MKRKHNRKQDSLREVDFELGINKYAEGSCLVSFGNTKVLCTASVENKVPPFLRNKGTGWITAEYGMLPRSTLERVDREAARGKQSGRTQEIQRLIGRVLRSIIDLKALGERQIKIDCDVLQADGGTRVASICGAYVSLYLAIHNLVDRKILQENIIIEEIAAVSCGIVEETPLLDLDYSEDSNAQADANFIITSKGNIVEAQVSSEITPTSKENFNELLRLAEKGIFEIIKKQRNVIFQFLQDKKKV